MGYLVRRAARRGPARSRPAPADTRGCADPPGARPRAARQFFRHPEDAAPAGAVAERDHQPRLGHGGVGRPQGPHHPRGDRSGHQKHVGMTRRGGHAEAVAPQIVVRTETGAQLMLAPVARARVDVAHGQRPGLGRGPQCRSGGGSCAIRSAGRTRAASLAVAAGVAELEALVDHREVGEDGARRRSGQRRASWRTRPCAGEAARRGRPAASRTQTVSPRGLSTLATPTASAGPATVPAGSTPPSSSSSSMRSVASTSRARTLTRLATSPDAECGTAGENPG